MRTNYRYYLISLEKALCQLVSEEVRTSTHFIMLGYLLKVAVLIINGVCPHKVTEEATLWYLPESINLFDIFQLRHYRLTVLSSGEMPPCSSRNFRLTRQANGRQSNISMVIS